MDFFDARTYYNEIYLPVFFVNIKSGRILFANRCAEEKGILSGLNLFKMLVNPSDYTALVKNELCKATELEIAEKAYSAKLKASLVPYEGADVLLVTAIEMAETRLQDDATIISQICDVYTDDQNTKKEHDFLRITANNVGAFCATLYEKKGNRYVIKAEWRQRKCVCIPILLRDIAIMFEAERLGRLKRAADTVYTAYMKSYGTLGISVYFFDQSAEKNQKESIKKYVDVYRVLSPDEPADDPLSIAKKGLDALNQGFVVWDVKTRRLQYENKRYRQIFGYQNPQYLDEKIGNSLRIGRDKTGCESYVDAKGRHYSVIHTMAKPYYQEMMATIIVDITKYKQAENKLDIMARTDALTGLLNRRAGLEYLSQVYEESKRHNHALTVCFADIDGLKQINDTYGHGAGDSMIKGVAEVLKKYVDHIGVVCRLGGDEFVLILPGMNRAQAMIIAEQIGRDAAKCLVGESQGISMSFGFKEAEYKQGETVNTLVSIADSDMYETKRSKSAK